MLDETVANATLEGFTALGDRINALADARLDSTLALHRTLFYATIGIIILVALFIFRPMSDVILRKTDELMDARNSMAFLAVHDGLTGLHNRAFLTDHFDTLIKGAQRRDERMAVVQIDLDRFKQINDTLGHAAGDYVLVVTAQRMRETCRASDICVRLGGDEFVMILQGAGSTEDINMVAKRIMSRINEPIGFQGATILPGASAGIAVYPVDADNANDLVVHADLALYAAKKQGGGAYSFFSEELRRELEHRKQLEHDLRVAIAAKSFQVYFQPQVSLTSGAIAGIEALVRWKHETRGMIPPGEFIPVAEKSGLMAEIGRIVIAKAIRAAGEWHRSGIQFGRLAVNVSGTELREIDFDKFLFETLEAEGLPPQKLSLEIVESVILDDEKTGIAAKLRHIRVGRRASRARRFRHRLRFAQPRQSERDRPAEDRPALRPEHQRQWRQHQDRARHHRAGARAGHLDHRRRRRNRGRAHLAEVDRLRPGAGLFHRLPDADRAGAGVACPAQPEKASAHGASGQSGVRRDPSGQGFGRDRRHGLCDKASRRTTDGSTQKHSRPPPKT